jgi:hypothetical protein
MQDAFLKSDISNNGLTRAFMYISIRYNPGALKKVPSKVIDPLLVTDLDIVDLKQ